MGSNVLAYHFVSDLWGIVFTGIKVILESEEKLKIIWL